MSIFATASFSGGLGQLVSGFVVQAKGWRWIHWHQLIINGVLMLCIAVIFKETRGPVLLSRKAKVLNKLDTNLTIYGEVEKHIIWKVKEDEERASISGMIKISLT